MESSHNTSSEIRPRPHSSGSNEGSRPAQRLKLGSTEDKDFGPLTEDDSFTTIDYRVCFFRVKDHLFQIHFFHLLRDETSIFHDMLSMPPTSGSPQGFTRADPVTLVGDSLEEIRAFHSLVYASPIQLREQFKPEEVEMLLCAALFSHKYGMTTFRDFAIHAIKDLSPTLAWDSLGMGITYRLLRLTWLCGPARYNTKGTAEFTIRQFIQQSWTSRLRATPSSENLLQKLSVAEECDFRSLIGDLYHLYLCQLAQKKHEPTLEPGVIAFPDANLLSDEHRSRLMAGYWSLNQTWLRFVDNVPPLARAPTCSGAEHTSRCNARWIHQWKTAAKQPGVLDIQSVDIFHKLSTFRTHFDVIFSPASLISMAVPCIRFAEKDYVAGYIRKLEDSLADHFLGPLALRNSSGHDEQL
ncbi:hypothetical protein C8R43DRAFT_1048754 [Mycena crocata]|nr:hypothetical protein C8R43DRAFT_1048754 [Mycena crocata]